MGGLEFALEEISLVLFTTLAPSGVAAYVGAALPNLLGRTGEKERRAIDRCLGLPLLLALVGLVASATHLGNPGNALYVLAGVGRSPLSSEVFAGAVFFGFAGIHWLTSFSVHPRAQLRRAGLACACVAGVVFVARIAFAYNVATIATWSMLWVPLALALNALVGGPLLALLTLKAAKAPSAGGAFGRGLCVVAACALVANAAVYALQGMEMAGIENHAGSAAAQVPGYAVMVAAFCALGACGIALAARWRKLPDGRAALGRLGVASALVLVGVFAMRLAFYMMRLTVGL